MIHPESVCKIVDDFQSDKAIQHLLKKLSRKKFASREEILDELSKIIEQTIDENTLKIVDLSRLRFIEKFGQFDKYRDFINDLASMMDMIEKIHEIVKRRGLSNGTMTEIEIKVNAQEFTGDKTRLIYRQLLDYLRFELAQFNNPDQAYLLSSDIEESLFGKFKYKLAERTGGIYSSVLSLCAFTDNFSLENIREAFRKCKSQNVESFFNEMTGISMIAKRRMAFNPD